MGNAQLGCPEEKDTQNGDQFAKDDRRYDSAEGPAAVGHYKPNVYGLFEMAGNVAEWTADWFDHDYHKHRFSLGPPGPINGEYKVIRGLAGPTRPVA